MGSMRYKPTNREKRRKSKRGIFWCGGCDMQLVGEWKKCPNCGTRNGIKRGKGRAKEIANNEIND